MASLPKSTLHSGLAGKTLADAMGGQRNEMLRKSTRLKAPNPKLRKTGRLPRRHLPFGIWDFIGIWILGFVIGFLLLNKPTLELRNGKVRTAHEFHQALFPRPNLFDCPLNAGQSC